MSFESRYHRFSSIKSMSFLSERLYGPLQVKHAIYLMFSIMFAWRGLSTGNASAIAFAVVVAFIGLVSAVVGVRTISFEAKVALALLSLFDSLFSSEPRPRRGKSAGASGAEPRSAKRRDKTSLFPGVRHLKVLGPSLAISIPGASYATYAVATSGLDMYTKTALVAMVVLAVTVPHILGLMWGGNQ